MLTGLRRMRTSKPEPGFSGPGFCLERRAFGHQLESLRNFYSDAEDNFDKKMNLYFTYESRNTLKSKTLFITVFGYREAESERPQ